MEDFEDFLKCLNDSIVKLKELLEKVTILHNKAAIGLLETSSVYNPQILVDITEMASNGRKFDKYILEGEELKTELENVLAARGTACQHSQQIIRELELLQKSISDNFFIDLSNI